MWLHKGLSLSKYFLSNIRIKRLVSTFGITSPARFVGIELQDIRHFSCSTSHHVHCPKWREKAFCWPLDASTVAFIVGSSFAVISINPPKQLLFWLASKCVIDPLGPSRTIPLGIVSIIEGKAVFMRRLLGFFFFSYLVKPSEFVHWLSARILAG